MFNGDKQSAFLLKSEIRQRCQFSFLLFDLVLEVLQLRKIQKIEVGKKGVNLSLFLNYLIPNLEDPKNSTRKL